MALETSTATFTRYADGSVGIDPTATPVRLGPGEADDLSDYLAKTRAAIRRTSARLAKALDADQRAADAAVAAEALDYARSETEVVVVSPLRKKSKAQEAKDAQAAAAKATADRAAAGLEPPATSTDV